tara:strand:+ start:189 stop:548 length:360 start_codon:yes stop_codon:yes gene_type:complete
MRVCNVCGKERRDIKYKHQGKKTCLRCETIWWRQVLRAMVKERRLTPVERIANRMGYMGSGFLMISPYLLPYDGLGAYTYILGAIVSMPQVWVAKQWNIVALNINLLIGYGIYIINYQI